MGWLFHHCKYGEISPQLPIDKTIIGVITPLITHRSPPDIKSRRCFFNAEKKPSESTQAAPQIVKFQSITAEEKQGMSK